ncbi:DNA helicase IV [Klenkia marina]|uniref:DNA helicase IV n=1 Tax=Klenkia marina TaxID=1960309 RepID=A0A1G4XUJ4_9ACTN|nr:AAA family ATPase [Klenkia marina]SCX44884.1 DNA helicase IV [Klenkia marina]
MPDAVLTAERAHLALAARCLTGMRAATAATADAGVDAWASERLGAARAERLRSLAADPGAPPFFGRTDTADETFHIGRRHVRDAAGDPVVIDWRAPMSRPFYQASAADPQGLQRRRRFGFADGELTSYEDESLTADDRPSELLRDEIERPRSGPMRDIVATIQPDQDDIVRAPLAASICVQGAPGTGKTAVGLHRAAYLLYTHGEQLGRTGVLVVGPNRAFLRYIEQVLPALGEVEVDQATVADLTGRVPVRAEDPDDVAVLKGDPRLADVLHRALWRGVTKPRDSVQVPLSGRRYRIPEERLRRYVDDLRRADISYGAGRQRLALSLAEDARRQKEEAGGSPSDADTRRCARSAEVRAFCDEHWPAVDAAALVASVLADPSVAGSLLTAEEQDLLRRAPGRSVRATRWTAADAVLVDEVAGLLERLPGYGHVVVDEAQDLSPMQCRAVARRVGAGSLTVLGDLAQATSPWSVADWSTTLAALGRPDAVVRPLTTGYRVPAEVLEFANRLLPVLVPGLAPATAVRSEPGSLRLRPVSVLGPVLAEVVRGAGPGSVGVVCADASVEELVAALDAEGVDAAALADDGGEPAPVAVVPATLVKGLEFDHVVVVEPAAIVAAEARGLHRLYVALTRAVSSLAVLHREPLPELLAG